MPQLDLDALRAEIMPQLSSSDLRAELRKTISILEGSLKSEEEYRYSLRAFKAAWHGVPLCEEPRC